MKTWVYVFSSLLLLLLSKYVVFVCFSIEGNQNSERSNSKPLEKYITSTCIHTTCLSSNLADHIFGLDVLQYECLNSAKDFKSMCLAHARKRYRINNIKCYVKVIIF